MSAPELFEIFDERGNALGLKPRAEVHRYGYRHRAAHVWLFDRAGRVLLQQRSPRKDIAGGRWDLSVGEHLKPGETFMEAARRGLAEELGISGCTLEPMGPPRHFGYEFAKPPVRDYEETRTFQARFDGPVAMPDGEVAATRWLDPEALAQWYARTPQDFTPWFGPDAEAAGIVGGAENV